ncbi:MAG: ATP-binding cassette domain-containing protein [Bacteroidota bacterium]|nr:ATP-binding cassette domain-containing protein [Bacteroidota bacterium]MDP4193603.1 ATP-binding cassette domain-containing protein [Bacteroidota bacterium]
MQNSQDLVKISELTKEFKGRLGYSLQILENLSFEIKANEFVTVLAPASAGKTTLLKIIAGIDSLTSGKIEFPFEKSNSSSDYFLSFIPSAPSSYPWYNVKQNIECFLKSSVKDPEEKQMQIKNLLSLVGLRGYEEHYPDNRSLGFRFRISLARALATKPKLLIIDEPFSNMDEKTRYEIYSLLREVRKNTGISILFSTSNIHEAFFLSDRIILLSARPAKIIDQIMLNLPVERDFHLLEEPYFQEIKNSVENKFKEYGPIVKSVLTV